MQNLVNNDVYETLGDRWYQAQDDPVALLRAESRVTGPWLIGKIKKHFPHYQTQDVSVLDIGCGGGFVSNPMAIEGFKVTGMDLSEESLKVAEAYDITKTVRYQRADAYQIPFADGTFDCVTAMDFLEHVERPADVVREISRVLKPGGLFFFHTFNRNKIAEIVIIRLVEWLVKNTPKNLHVPELFITPAELESYCTATDLKLVEILGTKPCVFKWSSLGFLFSGVVPKNFEFELTRSTTLAYLGYSQKSEIKK